MKNKKLICSTLLLIFCLFIGFKVNVDAAYYESEDNGTISSANMISVNNTVNGTNTRYEDYDYYRFNVPSDGYFTISITHKKDVGTHDFRIYDSNQDEFFSGSIDRGVKTKTTQRVAVKRGINYIRIDSSYGNYDPYSFSINFTAANDWEKEFNNEIDEANTILVNKIYNGTNTRYEDYDYYCFDAPSDGYITISMTHKRDEGRHDFVVYDSNQDEFFSGKADRNVQTMTSQRVAVKRGINYIRIDTRNGYNYDPYSFSINFSASKYWEKEFNNEIDEANVIELNKTYNGTNTRYEDYDYYRFDAPSDGYITISMTHKRDEGRHDFVVYDSNQDAFFSGKIDRNVQTMTSQKVSVKRGINYIRIDTRNGYNYEPYSFKISTVLPSYSIVYNLNGGINNTSNPFSYKQSSSNIYLKNPRRRNYLFVGWYIDASFKNKVSVIPSGSTGTKVLYARWAAVKVDKGQTPSLKRSKTQLKVSYKPIKGVAGYQIEIASDKMFKKSRKTASTKETVYTFGNLKKSEKYYVKVRGYKLDSTGSKVYGEWSNIKRK